MRPKKIGATVVCEEDHVYVKLNQLGCPECLPELHKKAAELCGIDGAYCSKLCKKNKMHMYVDREEGDN